MNTDTTTAVSLSLQSEKPSSAAVAEKGDSQPVFKKYKKRLRVEIVGLCVLMVIVWGLLTFPIVFFYKPLAVSVVCGANYIVTVQRCETIVIVVYRMKKVKQISPKMVIFSTLILF